jgi:hypothetical protein
MAGRAGGCTQDGSTARRVLFGLLLDADAPALRGRYYEHGVDRRSRCICFGREGLACGTLDWTIYGTSARSLGEPPSYFLTGTPARS